MLQQLQAASCRLPCSQLLVQSTLRMPLLSVVQG